MGDGSSIDAISELADYLATPGPRLDWAFDDILISGQSRIVVRLAEGKELICPGLDDPSGQRARSVEAFITALTGLLPLNDDLWPVLVEGLPHGASALLRTSPTIDSWAWVLRLVEVVAVITEKAAVAGDGLAQRRLPLVHRARFILLNGPRLVHADAERLVDSKPLGPTLDERARQAREDWLLDLVNHEDRPTLARWDPSYMDDQLRLVARSSEEESFIRWVVREGFLPRFMLLDAWKCVPRRSRSVALVPVVLLATVGVLSVAGLVGGVPTTLLRLAWVPASLAYLSMVFASAVDRAAGYLACLRLPAGSAVGLLAIMSFGSGWVSTPGAAWLAASATLLAASWGYLFLEAIAHGAPRVPAAGRAALVTALGFAHGVAVAAIAVPIVGRAFVDELPEALDGLAAADISQFLVLAASAGLAVGVFLQVLWDDRPVTYPLTHLAWRGRGRG